MSPITKDRVLFACQCSPRVRNFQNHPGFHEGTAQTDPYFSVSFRESIALVFEHETGITLPPGLFVNNYMRYLKTEDAVSRCKEWQERQGTRCYLKDCLSCSIALDKNFMDQTEKHTITGDLEYRAKYQQDLGAANALVALLQATIQELPFYHDAPLVCAVPPRPGKSFDLPSYCAAEIARRLGLTDITPRFSCLRPRRQIKELPLPEKWDALEESGLSLDFDLAGQDVILLDDKYQSGVTANFIGMLLQQRGAGRVLGLYAVKTRSNTDNL